MLLKLPIMLLKLPIMLWSNAPEFCLLCSNYAPYIYVSQYSPQIKHFAPFSYPTYLKYNIMSISCAVLIYLFSKYCAISSQSQFPYSLAHTAIHIHSYMYQHFEFLFVTQFDKVITTDSLKSHNSVQSMYFMQVCWHFVPIMLALFSMLFPLIMLIIMLA